MRTYLEDITAPHEGSGEDCCSSFYILPLRFTPFLCIQNSCMAVIIILHSSWILWKICINMRMQSSMVCIYAKLCGRKWSSHIRNVPSINSKTVYCSSDAQVTFSGEKNAEILLWRKFFIHTLEGNLTRRKRWRTIENPSLYVFWTPHFTALGYGMH